MGLKRMELILLYNLQTLYATQDVSTALVLEGTDSSLTRDWATYVESTYETGIAAGPNTLFVPGRIWG